MLRGRVCVAAWREFRGVLTGVSVFDGGGEQPARREDVMTEGDPKSFEQRGALLGPTEQRRDLDRFGPLAGRGGVRLLHGPGAGLPRVGGGCGRRALARRGGNTGTGRGPHQVAGPSAAVVRPAGTDPRASRGRFGRRRAVDGSPRQRHGPGAADAGGSARAAPSARHCGPGSGNTRSAITWWSRSEASRHNRGWPPSWPLPTTRSSAKHWTASSEAGTPGQNASSAIRPAKRSESPSRC